MRYQVMGLADGKAVQVELGYDEIMWSSENTMDEKLWGRVKEAFFWYAVDQHGVQLACEVDIRTLPELMNLTRGWLTWSRRLEQTMLNASLQSFVNTHPDDPVTKMLVSFDDRLKPRTSV